MSVIYIAIAALFVFVIIIFCRQEIMRYDVQTDLKTLKMEIDRLRCLADERNTLQFTYSSNMERRISIIEAAMKSFKQTLLRYF